MVNEGNEHTQPWVKAIVKDTVQDKEKQAPLSYSRFDNNYHCTETDTLQCDNQVSIRDKQLSLYYYAKAVTHYQGGDTKRALADINQAIKLDNTFVKAYQQRGVIYFNEGDINLAINDYTKAITLDANDALSWQYRGYAFLEKEDYRAVIEDLTQAISLAPECSDCYIYRGLAKSYYWTEAAALEDYSHVLDLNPSSALVHSLRGALLESMGEYEQARTAIEQAYNLDSTNTKYANQLVVFDRTLSLNTKLFEAVRIGDIKEIKSLLEQGADIHIRDTEDNSLLVYALALEKIRSLKVIQELINNQIRVRSISSQKESVLVRAAYLNYLEVVSWLLRKLTWRHDEKLSALAAAVNEGYVEVTREILSYIHEDFCGELIDKINQMGGAVSDKPPLGIDLKELKWACRLRILESYWQCLKWGVRVNVELVQSAGSYLIELARLKEGPQLIDEATAWLTGMVIWRRIGERLRALGTFPGASGEIIVSPVRAVPSYDMYLPDKYQMDKLAASGEEVTNRSIIYTAIKQGTTKNTTTELEEQPLEVDALSTERLKLSVCPEMASTLMLGAVLAKFGTQAADRIIHHGKRWWPRKAKPAVLPTHANELKQAQASVEQLKVSINKRLGQEGQDKWYRYGLEDLRDEIHCVDKSSLTIAQITEWQEELRELEADYAPAMANPVLLARARSNSFFKPVTRHIMLPEPLAIAATAHRQIAA